MNFKTLAHNKWIISFSILSMGLLIVASCATPTEASQELQYSKDYRTGLCFASRYVNSNNAVMTNVPCTSEVIDLIPLIPCHHEINGKAECSPETNRAK